MKLAYNELKEVVKEALIEILQEGLGNILTQASSRELNVIQPDYTGLNETRNVNKSLNTQKSLNQVIPARAEQPKKRPIVTPGVNEARDLQGMKKALSTKSPSPVKSAINSITNDPLMASIFSDTAKTTLVEQMQAEKQNIVATDYASRVAAENDPIDIFGGEAAGNWEKLAFSSKDLTKKHTG